MKKGILIVCLVALGLILFVVIRAALITFL